MYYIIETNYVGPNQDQDQYVDLDRIEISKSPAITNSSKEVRIEGWCGTTNDMAVYAHGEYASIEAAHAAIAEKFGDVRSCDANGDAWRSDDDDVVEVYKRGKYTPLTREAAAYWASESIQANVNATTTDERIAELVAEYEAEMNSCGYTFGDYLKQFMEARRQELSDEQEAEA